VSVDYFTSLSKKQQNAYRASDAAAEIVLPASAYEGLSTKTARLRRTMTMAAQGLQPSELHAVESASRDLVRGVCEALKVSVPEVRVHEVRPRGAYGELHGLYTRWTHRQGPGEDKSRIEVWMKTAIGEGVVAFKTFLRTLCHELAHHLDYVFLKLEDSLHTEGFFRRESSLVRQLDMWPQESRAKLHPKHAREAAPANETKESKLERLRKRLQRETAPARSETPSSPKRKTRAARAEKRTSVAEVVIDAAVHESATVPAMPTPEPAVVAHAEQNAPSAAMDSVHIEAPLEASVEAASAPLENAPSRRMIDKRGRRSKKPTAQIELTWGMDVATNEAQNEVSV
jgi:hypothetical protein